MSKRLPPSRRPEKMTTEDRLTWFVRALVQIGLQMGKSNLAIRLSILKDFEEGFARDSTQVKTDEIEIGGKMEKLVSTPAVFRIIVNNDQIDINSETVVSRWRSVVDRAIMIGLNRS